MSLTKQAKVLTDTQIETVLRKVATGSNPVRDRVMVLLSVKAGLRAKEIAWVTWDMVCDADGMLGNTLELRNSVSKGKGGGRLIPLNPMLRDALAALYHGQDPGSPIVLGLRGWMTAAGVTNWFWHLYRSCGLIGASSHSGRRTFITSLARRISTVGGSLRDVQELAGHSSLNMTARYICSNEEAKARAIATL